MSFRSRRMMRVWTVTVFAVALMQISAGAEERVLFDFEDAAGLEAWTALGPPATEVVEPKPRLELSTEGVTSGKHSLKIVFDGGHLPGVTTGKIAVDDWMPFAVIRLDLTVRRSCVVGVRVLQEKSLRFTGWQRQITRWQKVVALEPGRTTVTGVLHPNAFSPMRKDLGKVVALDLFACNPAKGQVVLVDNVRLDTVLPADLAPAPGVKTDLGIYRAPPVPKLPPAGGIILDATFNTRILRVTDEADGQYSTIAYSYWPTFNRDSTMFHLHRGIDEATLYRFDPDAFKILGKEPLFARTPAFPGGMTQEDSIWSNTDAKVIFGHSGARLLSYNIDTRKFTLVKDFSKDLPDQYLWQMSKSSDDNVFGFTTRKNRTWGKTGYIVWRRDTDKIVLRVKIGALDEIQVDKTGRYCLIKTGRQGAGVIEVRVADLETGKIVDLTDNAPDYSPGHSDNGKGFVIGADNWRPGTTFRRLATPHRHHFVMDFGGGHFSMLADDENWVLVSNYGSPPGPNKKLWPTFGGEIFQMATDGSQRVRRLGHHHSIYRTYYDSPRANISRDGRFVAFTSNWGGTKRRDVFILEVPPPPKKKVKVKTDRKVYPEPELPKLPKAGGTFVDPTFGTTLLRVTDERDGKSCHNAYAYWPTFNLDATRFHINCGGRAMLYTFDPDALRIVKKEPLFAANAPAGGRPNWEDAVWSGTDPDILFGHTGLNIWAWNVKTKKYTLVKNFAKEFPEPKGAFVSQMTVSIDDQTFAFKLKGPGPKWSVLRWCAWRRDTDRLLVNREAARGFDECHVDKTGRYLLVKERKGKIESAVVDLRTGKTKYLTDAGPDYGPGHSDNGRGSVVGVENHRNRVLFRKLSDPHKFRTVLDLGRDWSQGKHISMLADDEDWTLVSFYTKKRTPAVFRNEIIQAATDGSERVRRLCHHRSLYKSYWDSPRANISRDGRFVAFTSNWGGTDRRDVFILEVPPPPKKKVNVKTDRKVYPIPPAPKLPKAGETFVDPTFGTTLMRVTDERDGNNCEQVYSYYHTFNRTNTRFHINCGGKKMLYTFDPEAFKITGKEPLFGARPPSGKEPRWMDTLWSADDEDVVYCHEGPRLWAYNVKTKKFTLVKDFTGVLEADKLYQMSKSLDDNTFAFALKDAKWHVIGFAAWRRDTDKILLAQKAARGFDEVQIDKTGRYLVIKTGQQGRNKVIRVRVVDFDTGKTWNLTDYEPDWAPGHSDNGHGTAVGMDSHTPRITFRKLSDPHKFTTILKWGADWSQGRHISMGADDEGWVLISAYTGNKLKSNGLFRDEIMQVATDGSGRVRRLCHHHTTSRHYWDSPRANISRDGRFVTFTSNWGGSKRRDVFILKVPKVDKR